MVPTEYTAMAVPVFVAVPMPSPSIMSDKFVVGMQANIIATNNTPARPYILVETQENIDFSVLICRFEYFFHRDVWQEQQNEHQRKKPH